MPVVGASARLVFQVKPRVQRKRLLLVARFGTTTGERPLGQNTTEGWADAQGVSAQPSVVFYLMASRRWWCRSARHDGQGSGAWCARIPGPLMARASAPTTGEETLG